ncbi:hypothetical protein NM208_g10343 [Fusarium decemcellulare]|uniref:Uncharacterized protein n=2 Tax=Fusarium decemcellulare TaxID=57161 RepID=A0ACC1RV98_9HYPO|nr:hypothetical protein NM208_g11173 [Fusarium decemcellulare]KAJ3528137.1 hypothetical protein NM208_g10343 [Fusarium decemcellulare]
MNMGQCRQYETAEPKTQGSHPNTPTLDSFFRAVEEERGVASLGKDHMLREASPHLEFTSTEDIITALRILRTPAPNGKVGKVPNRHMRISHLVRFLVSQRKYPLDAFIYECMMDVMADPKGSALGVGKLLGDMAAEKITPTTTVCYSALEALAVHPDYVLRQRVINLMQKHWYEFTLSAKQNIAVGMLRDGQHELALDKFTELLDSEEKIDLWVYDVFIVEFGRMGFLDEVLQLLQQRKHAKGTDDAFRSLLYHALDIFSQAFHYEGTTFAWNYVVRNSLHNPSNGILENVLATAARHGDPTLATEAFNVRSTRGKTSEENHEALVDAFANEGDLAGAFNTLALMHQGGMQPSKGGTRSIYRQLRMQPKRIDEAASILTAMQKKGEVPYAAVDVTIEAMVQTRGSEAAIPLYHDIYFLTGRGPDKHLLRDLVLNSIELETKYALAKDWSIIIPKDGGLKGAMEAYDIMIPACAESNDLDLAFELANRIMVQWEEPQGLPRWRSAKWVKPLVELGLGAEDARVWPIVDGLDQGHDEPAKMVRVLLQRHRIANNASQTRPTTEERK